MLSDRPYIADDRTEELITDKIARLERENAELRKDALKPQYDQQALELCDACGWKAVIPGEGCLNCQREAALTMIDLNKIEAAAKSAPPSNWKVEEYGLFAATANPQTVLELVSMIRERDAVLRQALGALESCEISLAYGLSRIKALEAIAAIKEVLK